MKNDCHNCPDRAIKCHATCERYKAFAAANEAARAARYSDHIPRDLLVTGYINRAKLARTKTKKTVGRYRGT